jgi:diguanylate cyclase (GGDEF)-like protein
MKTIKKRPDHWIVEMNRRNRALHAAMLFVMLVTHLAGKGHGWLFWSLAVLQYLAGPQLMYYVAAHARHPRRVEMINLCLDGVFFGIWAAVLGFPVWVTFIFYVTIAVNLTVFLGKKGFFLAIACMAAGSALTVPFTGFHLAPETSVLTTVLCMAVISIYLLIVADNAFKHAIKLHETRKKLKSNEYALKQQLEEIKLLQSTLRDQANRDSLTGLYNRRYVDATLERELQRCRREGQPLSIVIIDVDHFKHINDTFGHQAGDEVLKMLASLLNDHVRASDVACRYGGEEFLVLFPAVTADVALKRVENWREAFAATGILFGKSDIPATISAGIATFPQHGESGEELIRRADLALYRAKHAGRNRVMIAGTDAARHDGLG